MATSLRRLGLYCVLAFVVAIIFLTQAPYQEYLPKYDLSELSPLSWTQHHDEEAALPAQEDYQPSNGFEEPESEPEPESLGYQTSTHNPPFVHSTSALREFTTSPPATTLQTSIVYPSSTVLPTGTLAFTNATTAPASQPTPTWSWEYTQKVIKTWAQTWPLPPISGHWPPYDGYRDKDYDPNMWEGFAWNTDIYAHSGIRLLTSPEGAKAFNSSVEPFMPYPDYNSDAWRRHWRGTYVPCEGARGKPLNASEDDMLKAFPVLSSGFPSAAIGYANVTGTSVYSHCIDRYHRYGPYGFGTTFETFFDHGDDASVEHWEPPTSKPDWTAIDWQRLQNKCLVKNKERWKPAAREPPLLRPGKAQPTNLESPPAAQVRKPSYHSRTAILIRTSEGRHFTEDDMQNIRALITELSLNSGGVYQVFLLVEVQDENMEIWESEKLYQDAIHSLPRELRSISILWNSKLFKEWYPMIGDWNNFWHPYMPLQWFSLTHPEFDFVWNWDADVRYTGNFYQLLEGVSAFARNTSRKYMWERNQRFYIPSAHGSYQEFLDSTHKAAENATQKGFYSPWGKNAWDDRAQRPIGPKPPRSLQEDNFEWGKGEDADILTFQPIWDPKDVDWVFKDIIWNFLPGLKPMFTQEDPEAQNFRHPEFAKIPRRTTIGSHIRFSARQLHAMHLENSAGRSMAAEMWPATVALHHGLKAVYVPHPIWTDHKWEPWYLDAVLNANKGEDAQWGQKDDSVWIHDRSHNLVGTTWFVASALPKTLYRRWLGLRRIDASPLAELDGGNWEEDSMPVDLPVGDKGEDGEVRIGGHGRMCLPPMLLHPVDDVENEAIIQPIYINPPPPAPAAPPPEPEPEAKPEPESAPVLERPKAPGPPVGGRDGVNEGMPLRPD